MISCEKTQAQLSEYASEQLPEALKDQIGEHLATCAACRQELATEFELIDKLADLPLFNCPKSVTANILDEIERDESRRNRPGHQQWWLGAASLVAAGLALIILLPQTKNNPPTPMTSSYSNEEIRLASSEARLALSKMVAVINQQEKSAFQQVFGQELPGAVGGSLRHITKNLQGDV